jgi:F0F1-type ATP synthase assembly protein I
MCNRNGVEILGEDEKSEYQVKHPRLVGLAASLGFSIVATLVVCIAAGLLLDEWLNTSPWLTLTGVALGLIGAGYQLWELVLISDNSRANGPLGRTMAQRMETRERTRIK